MEDHAGLQLDFVKEMQQEDADLSQVIEYLKKGTWPDKVSHSLQPYFFNIEYFALSDDILYRTTEKTTSRPDQLLLVIPTEMKYEILRTNHGEPSAGHYGINKTIRNVASRYYWPTLTHDVSNYCRSCIDCQTRKPGRHPKQPLTCIVATRVILWVHSSFQKTVINT